LRELGPKLRRSKHSVESQEIERLRRRNERLEDQLQNHKQALEIQGRASELLSRLLAESTEETTQQPDRREP
jgi:ABC-type transporter Mla subunit MlaD